MKKVIIIFLILFSIVLLFVNGNAFSLIDTLKQDSAWTEQKTYRDYTMHPDSKTTLRKIEERLINIENKQMNLDVERSIWNNELTKSNTIFTVFVSILLFVGGLLYYLSFEKKMKSIEDTMEKTISKIQADSIIQKSLIYRNLYLSGVALKDFTIALVWIVKSIEVEFERIDYGNGNLDTVHNFILNCNDIMDEMIEMKQKLSNKDYFEVGNTINEIKEKFKKHLSIVDDDYLDVILRKLNNHSSKGV